MIGLDGAVKKKHPHIRARQFLLDRFAAKNFRRAHTASDPNRRRRRCHDDVRRVGDDRHGYGVNDRMHEQKRLEGNVDRSRIMTPAGSRLGGRDLRQEHQRHEAQNRAVGH
ncbi:MAG: hypothetical protein ACR2II_10640 [Chthoniobacterales bacterium]